MPRGSNPAICDNFVTARARHAPHCQNRWRERSTALAGYEHPGGPVAAAFAERMRAREEAELVPLGDALLSGSPARPETDCGLRTPFQRDRDRIVHSKAFRRLKHKTQVFVAPSGDHYRTRLTHTLEVTQVSRTVARALRLNEDLVEAIGLGHDLGHPPFGHIGEEALDRCLPSASARRSCTTSTRCASSTRSSATGRAST